jgi:dihydrofolate synthase / folylpolyglutamate synthase
MTYDEALERLAALGPELRTGRAADNAATPARRKFSLDHIGALLKALGEPQRTFASVLIAGTNGKGSTASTLASISNAAGIKTGLYTSPHLLSVNERIKVSAGTGTGARGLMEIPDADFGRLYGLVDAAVAGLIAMGGLPHYPSFFELLTAIAFTWFSEQHVELGVLEVGLGGRLDATNAVEPIVSVITDIGIDHTEYLGNTIREIAGEKAGILRQDGVLVTLAQHQEANAAIGEAAVRLGVRGVDAARCLPGTRVQGPGSRVQDLAFRAREGSRLQPNNYDLSIEGEIIEVDSPLAGQHQQRNVALAIATALELRANQRLVDGRAFSISNAAIEQGIRETQWPGRLEWIASREGHAPLLLDVAHNPAGAWTLRAAISQLPEELPRTLIFGCLADKQIDEMEQVLLPLFDSTSGDPVRAGDHVILAPVHNPRAATIEELAAAARRLDVPVHVASDLRDALQQAESLTPKEGVIVATGSIFLVGEIRALVLTQAG